MAKKQIRIGVAGLGRIGWHLHALSLAQKPAFKLAAVTDPLPERRAEAEEKLGCVAYGDFATMLAEARLDAVVVATPTHLHKEMTLAALRAGCHVLLEKPMTVTAKEAESLVRGARRYDRVLTVYQPHRLGAEYGTLRRLLDSGCIGKLCRAQFGRYSFSRRNDWQSLRKYSGGMLNNYGAHVIDILLQVVGYDIGRVFCNLQRVATLGDADDAVKVVLETRGGVIGEADISQASLINPYQYTLWGNCGGIMFANGGFNIRRFDPAKLPPKALVTDLASVNREYPHDELEIIEERVEIDPALAIDVHDNFAAAIRGEAEVAVPPGETLKLMRLLDRLHEDSGRVLDFTL